AWSVGPRHLVPMIPFLALPLAVAARRLWYGFAPLLLLSIFYMLLATAVEPRVPYEYHNPARDLFLPNYLRGNLSLNRLGLFDPAAHPVAGDSTAFNLGEIAGLPRTLQLVPLLVFWLIAGSGLIYLTAGRTVFDAGAQPATADVSKESSPAAQPLHLHSRGKTFTVIAAWFLFLTAVAAAPPLHALHQKKSLAKGGGLLGKYYANRDWKGPPAFERKDAAIDFDWTLQMPLPAPFSVEWFGRIRIDRPGRYEFALESDDGSWLAFDNKIILNNGGVHARRRMTTSLEIPRAGVYPFAVRYFNEALGGMIRATWTPPGLWEQTIPSDVLSPPAAEERPQ
ncbi:MAG: PA14 domain-containing protein, partial [Candidatus Sumerlaeia bacterium]|nr:PA14 domain-containing protein [Candidatus Sumerlaeia bacterium]